MLGKIELDLRMFDRLFQDKADFFQFILVQNRGIILKRSQIEN